MRAIAPLPARITLEQSVEDYDPHNPRRHVITKPTLKAVFTNDTTQYERDIAKKTFKFNGLPRDEFTDMPVDPDYRISGFDTTTQGWDDETREKAEKLLLEHPNNGSDFIIVEAPERPAPWKGYDTITSVKKILELVTDTGSDAEEVLSYERENKNRPQVVEALELVVNPPVQDDEVVVEA